MMPVGRLGAAACMLVFGVLASGCQEDFGTNPTVASAIAAFNGQGQTGQVASTLANPLVARVTGSDEQPIVGVQVNWAIDAGDGSLSASSAVTDGAGLAEALWTLGTGAGEQSVRATVSGVDGAASFTATAVAGPAVSVGLSETNLHFTAFGETRTLSASGQDEYGNPVASATGTWSSTNEAVVRVNGSGVVTAQGNGTAEIHFDGSAGSATANVEVEQATETVSLSSQAETLNGVGATVELSASVLDANDNPVEGAAASWTSRNPSVATVDAGLVTAVAAGETWIVAESGGRADSAAVTVVTETGGQTPAAVEVSPGLLVLGVGGAAELAVEVFDAGGTIILVPEFTTETRDAGVATVDGTTVTAVALGTTDVVASSEGVSDSARVAVAAEEGFAFIATTDPAQAFMDVEGGSTIQVDLWLIRPEGGTGGLGSVSGTLVWNSAVLEYQGSQGLASGFSWTPNETEVGSGTLTFGSYAAQGRKESFAVARVTFTVLGAAGSASELTLDVSAAGDEDGSTNITDLIQTVKSFVEVQP